MTLKNQSTCRLRFAPSPTGYLHIGNLRTILTNYLFARHYGGDFIVRLEDTDQARIVQGAAKEIIKSLKWAGLEWEEGIDLDSRGQIVEKGSSGPYIQSKRLAIYQKMAEQLIRTDQAYYCFCSRKRLENMRQTQIQRKQAPMYDRYCRQLTEAEIKKKLKNKEPYVIRLKVAREEETVFKDLVRGRIRIENRVIDDQVLVKSDGFPTYHLAVVVDDHLMKITHVFRSEEWLPSVPKHILIYKAFGFKLPYFGHLPQLLNMNGKKLSKRDGEVAVKDFRYKGYLSEAVINYIALLGWNPKTTQEIFSLEELVKQFDERKLNKAGAKFDYARLNWYQAYYLKRLTDEKLFSWGKAMWQRFGIQGVEPEQSKIEKILLVQKQRVGEPAQIFKEVDYLLKPVKYATDLLKWKNMSQQQVREQLNKAWQTLDQVKEKDFELERIQQVLTEAAAEKRGEFLWPLRVALSGKKQSVSPFECAWVLGKKQSKKRIEQALNKIK
ncbi:MAG: glutamate--tRNA ligase [Candidatus Moranbacteria bacterium]|nr:glutamate--tRNA ligase [Candidatus Moranbacteria bacterium]